MATLSSAEARRHRASKHADRAHTCFCGRTVHGNGGWSSHARACPTYREKRGVFVPDWQLQSLFEQGYRVEDVRAAARQAADEGRDRL